MKVSLKKILDAVENSFGIKTTICKRLGVSRPTFDKYIKRYPEVHDAVEHSKEVFLDFTESKLIENIKNNDTACIIFTLRTKGKKRGYEQDNRFDITTKGEGLNKITVEYVTRVVDDKN